jgi:hypothetical protein
VRQKRFETYVKKNIILPPELAELLHQTAVKLGVMESDVIRQALVYYCLNEAALKLTEYSRYASRRKNSV